MNTKQIIVIGGGLAGLTAAIDLCLKGYNVLVLEKNSYPHHKVCGEYVSNEVVPYLSSLGINLSETGAVIINEFQLSIPSGKSVFTKLPLGGFGISRYAFDYLLYKKAVDNGVEFSFEEVVDVAFQNNIFSVFTKENTYQADQVIGSYGKRSIIDKKKQRDFINKKSNWLAVKAHYTYPNFPSSLVGLHNFKGGYGGLSTNEEGTVNFCYLVHYKVFKLFNGIEHFNSEVVSENVHLKKFLQSAKLSFDAPMSIAQISFDKKDTVENHMLMCGDAAGLIHPLCGNGMAMAIHSAKLASDAIEGYFTNPHCSREKMEKKYAKEWQQTFGRRLWMGKQLQQLMLNPRLSALAMYSVVQSSYLLKKIIKSTHGSPIVC